MIKNVLNSCLLKPILWKFTSFPIPWRLSISCGVKLVIEIDLTRWGGFSPRLYKRKTKRQQLTFSEAAKPNHSSINRVREKLAKMRANSTHKMPLHDVQTNDPMVVFTYVGPLCPQSKHFLLWGKAARSRRSFKFFSSCFLLAEAIMDVCSPTYHELRKSPE